MIEATHHIRIQQIAKMVQKELATFFLTEGARLLDHAFVSITTVDLSSDLSLATVYLSFALHDDQEGLLQKMNGHKNTIRRFLGKRVAGKIHKVPNLKFRIDRSVIQGARVTALIDQLD